MDFNTLNQQVSISYIFQFEGSYGVVNFKHNEVVCFGIDILYIEIADIFEVEEKSPLKHLPFLIVEHRSRRDFLLICAVGYTSYFLLQLYQLGLGHYQTVTKITNFRGGIVGFENDVK